MLRVNENAALHTQNHCSKQEKKQPQQPIMGITNLLPQLSSISHKVHFSELNNTEVRGPPSKKPKPNDKKVRAAIDISAWIASACHGNGAELMDERHFTNYGRAELLREHEQAQSPNTHGEKANNGSVKLDASQTLQIQQFITRATNSVLRKISSLEACLSADILVVFDGATPPIKKTCCEQRKKSRNDAASLRDQVLGSSTNSRIDAAHDHDVDNDALKSSLHKINAAKKAGAHTSEIYMAVVTSLLKSLRERHIPFLVSPYEADGQLAFLSCSGLVDLIISEDSDFIGHGAKAVLYKYKEVYVPYGRLNEYKPPNREATGVLIRRSDLGALADQSFDLSNFTDSMLAVLCVAAGCDYCSSLRGIGIITARNAVKEAFLVNSVCETYATKPKLEKVFEILFRQSYGKMSEDQKNSYIESFLAALVMFRHPVVFHPICRELIFANIGTPDIDLMDYEGYATIVQSREKLQQIVGKIYEKDMALHVVEGYINPKTWSLFNSENETPPIICEALRKWNVDTYKFEMDNEKKDENNNRKIVIASQSSSGTSSAGKLSSQTSSNVSVLSPNLLI